MAALDFWNRPQWLGDERDHPGDPNHEPFWMREQSQDHEPSEIICDRLMTSDELAIFKVKGRIMTAKEYRHYLSGGR